MSTAKLSATLDAGRVAEAKARVGERGLSRYLDDALARMLQHDRLIDLERDLTEAHGPIPPDVQEAVDSTPWPK